MPNKHTDNEELAKNLQPIYQYLSHQYTKGVRIPDTVPTQLRQDFYEGLKSYDRTMAQAVSQVVVTSFSDCDDLSSSLKNISAEMQQQTRRLSNTYYQLERRAQMYDTLAHNPEYPIFLYLSEQGDRTCDTCHTHHGTLLTKSDLFTKLWLIPPVHPNCKCSLVAMDTLMATRYNQHKEAFLAALEATARQYAPVY